MTTKYYVLLAALHFAVPVEAQRAHFSVTVQYAAKKYPAKLYLQYDQKIDSATSKNGTFKFEGKLSEPILAVIREPLSSFFEQKTLFLDNEDIRVFVKDSIQHAVIKESLINEMNGDYQAFISAQKLRYDSLSTARRSFNDEKKKDSLKPFVREAFSEFQQQQIQYVQKNPDSWMSLVAINDLLFSYCMQNVDSATAAARFKPLRAMFDRLNARIRVTPTGKLTNTKIEGLLNSQVGSKIIPFAQLGHDGAPVNTMDYKGKYFLVDFWGSWCVWCRKGHPHLKEIYNRYKSKGFEIIAVSKEFGEHGEQTKNWLEAIEKDDIRWKHIMVDPKNDLTERYAIVAYPTKFLINPDGKIILRVGDDEDKQLDKMLEHIYQ